jgi:hypothetical protein
LLGTKEQYTATKFNTITEEAGPNRPVSTAIPMHFLYLVPWLFNDMHASEPVFKNE